MTVSRSTRNLTKTLRTVQRVNDTREQAVELCDGALRSLCAAAQSNFAGWDTPVSPVTRLLLRRAKHLAFHLGVLPNACEFPMVPNVGLSIGEAGAQPDKDCVYLYSALIGDTGKGGPVPDEISVFFAAQYLRVTVEELPSTELARLGYLPGSVFFCLYRILREVLTVEIPAGHFGAAKAGEYGGTLSTFVTAECARSIGRLASLFETTANVLTELTQISSYAEQVAENSEHAGGPLPDDWCQAELRRTRASLRTLIDFHGTRSVLRLDKCAPCTSAADAGAEIWASMKVFCDESLRQLTQSCTTIEDFRAAEAGAASFHDQQLARFKDSHRGSPPLHVADAVTGVALTATAHHYALNLLAQIAGFLQTLARTLSNPITSELAAQTREPLKGIALVLRRSLDPVATYMRATMFERLWDVEHKRSVQHVQDLLFASSTSGAIRSDWSDPVYAHVAQIGLGFVDPTGQLPLGLPFQVSEGGKEKRAINIHSIRALVQVAQKSEYDISIDDVARLYAAFQVGLRRDTHLIGWTRTGVGTEARPSPWVSAVAALALHRLCGLLDQRINRLVLSNFRCRTPAQLKGSPRIRELMCSDVGLSSIKWEQRKRTMVTEDLEAMRAHVLSSSRGSRPDHLRSLIAFGPPGTGKTTLAAALALSCNVPLVEITPSEFIRDGADMLDLRAELVMGLLEHASRCVILFDEFDPVFRTREDAREQPQNEFTFLTGNMLPRLARLHDAAKKRGFVYLLATNYVGRLDDAVTRQGRFDAQKGVYAPDLASRMCRLVSQVAIAENTLQLTPSDGYSERAAMAARRTSGTPMSVLGTREWFTLPSSAAKLKATAFWRYLFDGGPEPEWPEPTATRQWSSFAPPRDTDAWSDMEIAERLELELVREWDAVALEGEKSWIDLAQLATTDVVNAAAKYRDEYTARKRRR